MVLVFDEARSRLHGGPPVGCQPACQPASQTHTAVGFSEQLTRHGKVAKEEPVNDPIRRGRYTPPPHHFVTNTPWRWKTLSNIPLSRLQYTSPPPPLGPLRQVRAVPVPQRAAAVPPQQLRCLPPGEFDPCPEC